MKNSVINPGNHVHIHRTVSDMKETIDFYVVVLGYYYQQGIPDMAWLTRENQLLTISPGDPTVDLGNYLGWVVSDYEELEKLYDRLYKRHQKLSQPPSIEEERMYFFLYDPDNYPIIFSCQVLEK